MLICFWKISILLWSCVHKRKDTRVTTAQVSEHDWPHGRLSVTPMPVVSWLPFTFMPTFIFCSDCGALNTFFSSPRTRDAADVGWSVVGRGRYRDFGVPVRPLASFSYCVVCEYMSAFLVMLGSQRGVPAPLSWCPVPARGLDSSVNLTPLSWQGGSEPHLGQACASFSGSLCPAVFFTIPVTRCDGLSVVVMLDPVWRTLPITDPFLFSPEAATILTHL